MHMKWLIDQFPWFIDVLVKIFNDILKSPQEMMPKYKILFEFTACFLPKSDGKYRPIAIGE